MRATALARISSLTGRDVQPLARRAPKVVGRSFVVWATMSSAPPGSVGRDYPGRLEAPGPPRRPPRPRRGPGRRPASRAADTGRGRPRDPADVCHADARGRLDD